MKHNSILKVIGISTLTAGVAFAPFFGLSSALAATVDLESTLRSAGPGVPRSMIVLINGNRVYDEPLETLGVGDEFELPEDVLSQVRGFYDVVATVQVSANTDPEINFVVLDENGGQFPLANTQMSALGFGSDVEKATYDLFTKESVINQMNIVSEGIDRNSSGTTSIEADATSRAVRSASEVSQNALRAEDAEQVLPTLSVLACQSQTECLLVCESNEDLCNTHARENVNFKADSSSASGIELILLSRDLVRAFVDSDSDGISDYDEVNIYETHPLIADTDEDGILDGVEIETSQFAKKTAVGTVKNYEDVRLASSAFVSSDLGINRISITQDTKGNSVGLRVQGYGPVNSYVVLYLFSDPIVAVTKTDAEGAFEYTSDVLLSNGEHDAYVTISNDEGNVLVKSPKISFNKTDNTVQIKEAVLMGEVQTGTGKKGFFSGVFGVVALVVLLLAFALIVVVLTVKRKPNPSIQTTIDN